MPQGKMVSVGLNSVDPNHYDGWDGRLNACEADAKDMKGIGDDLGFETKLLLTKDATADNVIGAIREAAGELQSGDIFVYTQSGHGGRVRDTGGDEPDAKDETWLCYDRQIIDDELYALWADFKPGVRIFVLSDTCHSGTVTKAQFYEEILIPETVNRGLIDAKEPQPKAMPAEREDPTYEQNRDLYDSIQKEVPEAEDADVEATVLLISGCQDNQFSMDGERNGAFTGALRKVWDEGEFAGSYRKFHREIQDRLPPSQSPNFYVVGERNRNFIREKPFTI
jgi:metacaspase-1